MHTDPTALLSTLLAKPPPPETSLADYRALWATDAAAWPDPIDRALLGGWRADRLGYAFVAGYRAAVERLAPGVGAACLSVTEDGGAHPRAVATRLTRDGEGWRLSGTKRWATPAEAGGALLVVASERWDGDRNVLRVARVPADAPGVTLARQPETPFTPEIPHYTVHLDAVRVADADVLPGDGWTRYVRPFRTVEDVHVAAAAAAHLLRVARGAGWPPAIPSRLTALILALRALGPADPDAPAVHVALGGCFAALDAIVTAAEPCWASTDPDTAARWRRDAPLLGIASKARAARFQAAWERVRGAA